MIQMIIAGLLVAAAVFFAVRRLLRTLKGRGGCGCGCHDCPYSKECHQDL